MSKSYIKLNFSKSSGVYEIIHNGFSWVSDGRKPYITIRRKVKGKYISISCPFWSALKKKTEIDVRQPHTGETGGITSSPLGNGVIYINCPMDWTGDLHNENKEQLLKIFEILSNEENYPLIIHCSIGTDRTGMLSFLINALLGIPEEDLCRDYLFSNYAQIGGKRDISKLTESMYYNDVKNAPGKTLSEKAYNYLWELGVPAEQLDSVVSILSE